MVAPQDEPAFDLEIATRAADNFKARKKQSNAKEKAIDEKQYTKAESPERLAKRVNRLIGAVHGTIAAAAAGERGLEAAPQALPQEVHELMQQGPIGPADVTDASFERVIGATRDFLAIGFFEKGIIASRAVCRIVTNLGGGRRVLGTGFMVTPSLLITNNHVLRTEDDARRSVAEFNYQLTDGGAPLPVERFGLRPDVFFLTDRDLDFALVGVEQRSASGTALSSFAFCPLIAAEGKIIVRDPVNTVQHPKGELKQIAIRNNTLVDLPDPPLDRFAHYETDTEQGSSGSPVFNDQWEVIALHHSGVPRTNANKQILDRKGNVWPPNGNPDDIDWISNEGIRTSRLVTFIKAAAVRTHEKVLQDEFIAISSGNIPAVPPKPAAEGATVHPKPTPSKPAPSPAPRPRRGVSAAAPVAVPQHGTVSLTIPLTVSINRTVHQNEMRPDATDRRVVNLLFATTRKPEGGNTSTIFTDERSSALAFGAVKIRVPESHNIGRVKRPWNLELFGWSIYQQTENPKNHFIVRKIKRLTRGGFINSIIADDNNQALVFVHGFNTTFDDACFRLAQIVWDTHFGGVPIVFSCPSQGKVLAYFYDRDSAIFSRIGFRELLTILLGVRKLSALHILAHSMGNQIVLDELTVLGQSAGQSSLAEVIFAAPDVDRDVFVGLAPGLKKVARGFTLYASARDKALVASRQIARQPRAGDVPAIGPIVVPNIDTIDVTAIGDELFGFNHNTFAAQRSLIDDVGRLISSGQRPPHLRTPQLRCIPEAPEATRFWRYPK